MRRILAAIIALACIPVVQAEPAPASTELSARKRVRIYMRVKRPKPQPAPRIAHPEPSRLIPIHCSDLSATFIEVWCHRVDRALYQPTFK